MIYALNHLWLLVMMGINLCRMKIYMLYTTDYYKILIKDWSCWKMQQDNFDRKDLIIASLTQQVANLVGQLADREATITEQHMELEQLRKEIIGDMDGEENAD